MKKTTFYTSIIVLIFMGTFLFLVSLENYYDTMLPTSVRENFIIVGVFGLMVSMFGCLCGITQDKSRLI